MRYRDLPKFMLWRIDRIAGEVNVFLAVIVVGLLLLDLLYAGHKLAHLPLPPVVEGGAHGLK